MYLVRAEKHSKDPMGSHGCFNWLLNLMNGIIPEQNNGERISDL